MKIMPCPLNGPRPIQEFQYGGELRDMPDPQQASDDQRALTVECTTSAVCRHRPRVTLRPLIKAPRENRRQPLCGARFRARVEQTKWSFARAIQMRFVHAVGAA